MNDEINIAEIDNLPTAPIFPTEIEVDGLGTLVSTDKFQKYSD